jgi:hypothetical protein
MKLIIILFLTFLFCYTDDICGQISLINKTYNNRNLYEGSMCVLYDSSSQNYITGGNTNDLINYNGMLVIKLNSFGDTIWQRSYDLTGVSNLMAGSCFSKNGHYMFVGAATDTIAGRGDVLLMELDTSGNLLWWKRYGTYVNDIGQGIKLTSDGGYILVGWSLNDTSSTASTDGIVLKVDSMGVLQWDKKISGTTTDLFYSVDLTFDNGYILGGRSYSFGTGGSDLWIVKIDSLGNLKWQKTFGSQYDDFGHTVISTRDSGFVIVGSYTISNNTDAYIVKIDSQGNFLWDDTFGTSQYYESFFSVCEAPDRSIVAVGTSGINTFEGIAVKYKSDGTKDWSNFYRHNPFSPNNEHYFYDVKPVDNRGFVISGMTIESNQPNNNDVWMVVVDSMGCDNSSCVLDISDSDNVNEEKNEVFPNPTSSFINIEFNPKGSDKIYFEIYDFSGNLVKSQVDNPNQLFHIDISDLTPGIYILKLKQSLVQDYLKFIVQ